MERSTTQVIYRYLPGRIFSHDDGFLAQVNRVQGGQVSSYVNQKVLLEELARELEQWRPDQRRIPDPLTNPDEYLLLEPREVSWDVYPLTFECTNQACKRVKRWFTQKEAIEKTSAAGRVRCGHCNTKMRQLRYLTAHECGDVAPLHTPKCPVCKVPDNMYLEDLGTFRSSTWRCRTCSSALSTRFTPCSCGRYAAGDKTPYRTGYTARDGRLWYPQLLTIINIADQTYDHLQVHDHKGLAALASWVGDEPRLAGSLRDLERPSGGKRYTEAEWAVQEDTLRAANMDEEIIARVRAESVVPASGVTAFAAQAGEQVVEAFSERPMLERAALFDVAIVGDRRSYADIRSGLSGVSASVAEVPVRAMAALGIADVSVTEQFPIVLASYGYTRSKRTPGEADLRGYAQQRQYRDKTPIFALPANTEAILVTMDAEAVVGFLASEGDYTGPLPADAREAKLSLAALLAADPTVGGEGAAGKTRRLMHSCSHALLRALDDGQSGFGESSLAEWIVPDVLTTGIYVASYNDFTLGAFDTVLRRRLAPWLLRAAEDVVRCDNDPMCEHTSPHRPHAACDRCLHLSFGCRTWNADLDRKLLRRYWRWTQTRAAAT